MLFTIKDLHYKLGVSIPSLRTLCKKHKIEGVLKDMPNSRKTAHYSYEQMEKIRGLAKSIIIKNRFKDVEFREEAPMKANPVFRFKRVGGIDPVYTVYEIQEDRHIFRGSAKESYLVRKGLLKIND